MHDQLRRLVVIDDNEIDLRLIARALRREAPQLEIDTCLGSEQAVDLITDECTDMVLLDINMPGLDGFDVLSEARARKPSNFPPVLMLSTSETKADIRKAYAAGAAAYLVKPAAADGYSRLASAIGRFWGDLVARSP